jgi:hypothetical protein
MKQLLDRNIQCLGDSRDVLERRIPEAEFDPAKIRPVNSGLFGQLLLRDTTLVAKFPDPDREIADGSVLEAQAS